jgi:uncharacterized protein (DUF362 family)/NAD-dependent dihydropyrimidine dehydrogenase PreA subunit
MKVLIKPNLCSGHPPEKAITSHPVLVEQIIKLLQEQGAEVTIGDSPIGQVEKKMIEKIWEVTGFNDVVKRTGCQKSTLDKDGLKKEVLHLNGISFEYYISREYINAHLVINVPKFKTHVLMGFTGAVKNILGIIPGRSKVQLHRFAPAKEDFSNVLVEVYSRRVPEFTVMDAIEGIEGDGPTSRGEKREFGLLLISNDGVLVDATCTRLMGLDIEQILTNRYASRRGLGNTEAASIYLSGFKQLEDCVIEDFKLPASFAYSNTAVIKRWFELGQLNMSIDLRICTGCRRCLENCPVEAIQIRNNQLFIDKTKCIQCMCCLEICPLGAVEVSKNKFYQQLKELRKQRDKNKEALCRN